MAIAISVIIRRGPSYISHPVTAKEDEGNTVLAINIAVKEVLPHPSILILKCVVCRTGGKMAKCVASYSQTRLR